MNDFHNKILKMSSRNQNVQGLVGKCVIFAMSTCLEKTRENFVVTGLQKVFCTPSNPPHPHTHSFFFDL